LGAKRCKELDQAMIVRILHQAALDDLQRVGDMSVGLIIARSGNDDVDRRLASIVIQNRQQAACYWVSWFQIQGFFHERLSSMPIGWHEFARMGNQAAQEGCSRQAIARVKAFRFAE
jgi:hypothetical protein